MKNVSKYEWVRAIGAIGIAAAVTAGCATPNDIALTPATQRVAISKVAVDNAVSAGGIEFAPYEMKSAQDKLSRANLAMTEKNYQAARWLAEQAQVDADLAASKSRTAQAQKASLAVQEDSRVLKEELERKSK